MPAQLQPESAEEAADKDEEKSEAPRYLPLETVALRVVSDSFPPRHHVFGIVSNISRTGGCIIVNQPIDTDATVELDVELTRQDRRLSVKARVVWCAERIEPVKEIVGYLVGVSFLDSRATVDDLLKSGIFQLVP